MANLPTTTKLRGLALPAKKGPGGFFESKVAIDVAWGDLLLTLFTPAGTRVMRRDFGSVLREQLFEANSELNDPIIDHVIREAASDHCPQVVIRNVTVTREENRAQVQVSFSLRTDTSSVQTREVIVPKVHLS